MNIPQITTHSPLGLVVLVFRRLHWTRKYWRGSSNSSISWKWFRSANPVATWSAGCIMYPSIQGMLSRCSSSEAIGGQQHLTMSGETRSIKPWSCVCNCCFDSALVRKLYSCSDVMTICLNQHTGYRSLPQKQHYQGLCCCIVESRDLTANGLQMLYVGKHLRPLVYEDGSSIESIRP